MKKAGFSVFRTFFITFIFTIIIGGGLSCFILLNNKNNPNQGLTSVPGSDSNKENPQSDFSDNTSNTTSNLSNNTSSNNASSGFSDNTSSNSASSGLPDNTSNNTYSSSLNNPDYSNSSGFTDNTDNNLSDSTDNSLLDLPFADSSETSSTENTDYKQPDLSQSVTLCLMGDLMCLAGQQYAAEKSDGSHDYSGSFAFIQPLLADCDIVFGNLETILSESSPYTTEQSQINDSPNCNAPADYLDALKWAGFDGFTTANNHSLDGGVIGITETLLHLEQQEFVHTGTYYSNDSSNHFLIFDNNGIQTAILSFTELINQRDLLPAGTLEQYIDCYSKKLAQTRINEAKEAGAEYIIVYIHWGSENIHDVREYQRTHAKELADAGADLIIGSHPHCLQEYECIFAADKREVPCFYSLGNLISSMVREINNDTVLLFATLKREGEDVKLNALSLLPCHVFRYLNGSPHVIVPCSSTMESVQNVKELSDAKERISAISGFLELLQ